MTTGSGQIFVQVAAGSAEEASKIARAVVERKLAACAQIFPMQSCYEWNGTIVDDNEYLMFIKSHQKVYEKLEACIKEFHSYEVPEIIALPIGMGSKSYLNWIDGLVLGGTGS